MDDMTLARTYAPIECMECSRHGLTVDECATLHAAELHATIAYADHDMAAAPTAADTVSAARAKSEAKRRLRSLREVPRQRRVALIDPEGFPVAVLDRDSLDFRARARSLKPTGSPGVFVL